MSPLSTQLFASQTSQLACSAFALVIVIPPIKSNLMLGGDDEDIRDAPHTLAEQEVAKSCLAIVDEHRNGLIDRSKAILKLTGILQGEEYETVLVQYLDQKHETKCTRASAEQHGNQVESRRSQSTLDTGTDQGINAGDDIRKESGECRNIGAGSWKRLDADFADDDVNGLPKRQCDDSLFGWKHTYVRPTPVEEPCDPILERTLKLKQNYLLDSKGMKAELVGQRGCPKFLDSLWIDVLLD
ncbi:hypothetical protein K439DRAFT_1625235 [Ramaria rubella]|nr:hypothetical protein K439DRAFT_1625235 [Ramaria rubella]